MENRLTEQLLEGVTSADIEESLGYREEPDPEESRALGFAPERLMPEWSDVVSPPAYEFIRTWETGGKAYYEGVIKGRPIWPGFSSGITIGCGYDLGYHERSEFAADWGGRISPEAMRRLEEVIGFRTVDPGRDAKVAQAKELVRARADIQVPWDVAVAQFDDSKMPALVGQLERALPNLDRLHPHSYGALLSLVFNRGASFRSPSPRFAEMVEIRKLMEEGTPAAFAQIPAQLRAMERIWGATSSLAKRRHGEAELFERGLREMQPVS